MRRWACAWAAALFTACATSGSKSLPDSGAPDSGPDGGPPDSGPFTLPIYTTGVVLLDDAGCPPLPAQPDLFDTVLALADAGLNRCNLTYPGDWHLLFRLPDGGGGIDDEFVLPYFNQLHDHPLLVPSFASNLSGDLDSAGQSSHPVSESLAALAARLGLTVTATDPIATWAPSATDGEPLSDALILLGAATPDAGWASATAGIPTAACKRRVATLFLNGLAQGANGSGTGPISPRSRPDSTRRSSSFHSLLNEGGIGNQKDSTQPQRSHRLRPILGGNRCHPFRELCHPAGTGGRGPESPELRRGDGLLVAS